MSIFYKDLFYFMPNNTVVYIFNRIVRLAIIFFILYLIFTNFGTFLMILGTIFIVLFLIFYYVKKKIKANNYQFKYSNYSSQNNHSNFNFNDFNSSFSEFRARPRFDEIHKAKEFFGFTNSPTKEEIKKRYKELARKYHPDINQGDDTMMKELNHYRDVLMKTVE